MIQFDDKYKETLKDALMYRRDGLEEYYDTPITNYGLGHLKEDDVTKVMQQIQELPNPGA